MLAMVCCRVDMVLAIVAGGGSEKSRVCSCRSGFTRDISEINWFLFLFSYLRNIRAVHLNVDRHVASE